MNPYEELSSAREMATGSRLLVDAPNLAPQCKTELEFDALVTEYYKFFCEEISADVAFLTAIRQKPSVDKARKLLYNLRTATQHSDNEKAVREAQRWREEKSSPQSAAESLASVLETAINDLKSVAIEVSRNVDYAERWLEILTVDTGTVFEEVVSDLGLSFTKNNQKRMVRLVETRLKVKSPTGDRRRVIADYCVQEALSQHDPLPVEYHEVLDSLGLLHKQGAAGALLIAYSVARLAPSLPEESFLARVKETFLAATSPQRSGQAEDV